LKEADGLWKESHELAKAGKLAQAAASAEKVLAIERAVLGPTDVKLTGTLACLAGLYEAQDDFPRARQARQNILTLLIRVYGKDDWRATDARLALENTDRLPSFDPVQRQQLAEAWTLNRQAIAAYRAGRTSEAIEIAQRALQIRERILGPSHPDYAQSLNNLARLYYAMGAYAKAEPLYRQALEIRRKALGEAHPDFAQSLNNLAGLYVSMGAYAKAEPLYRQALEIRRKALGEAHPDFATSLNNLATLYQLMGAYAKAEPLYRQALEIRKALGETNPDYADILNNLAELYKTIGDNAKAEPIYRQSLEIRRKALGEAHPDYAQSLSNLAGLYFSMGDYAKAEPLYRQALEIRQKALGEAHPDYAITLNNLAQLYRTMGDYGKAEPLYRQSLEIRRKALGEAHPDYATSLNSLAFMYSTMGDYAKAEPLYRQALEIDRKALGVAHPDYATHLNNLAGLYFTMGDYARAEHLYRQVVEIYRKALGEAHADYANSLNNLAGLYSSMGDYGKAEPLHRQALEIRRKALGEAHPDYANSLNNLAELYYRTLNYAMAEPLYRQAVEIRQKALGEAHPDYATSLNNLGRLYYSIGDYAKAEPLFRHALEIRRKALTEVHPDYANSLNNLAFVYESKGDYARAEPLFRQALEIRRKALGEAHPDYATSLNNLALFYMAMGQAERGELLVRQALQVGMALLERTAAAQSERQQLRMAEVLRFELDNYLSAAAAAHSPPEEVYAGVLTWKGAILARQQALHSLGGARQGQEAPEAARLAAALVEGSRRLAGLSQAAPDPKRPGELARVIKDQSERVEELERQLAAASPEFAKERQRRRLSTGDLCKAMPAGTALVDFLEYRRYTPGAKGQAEWPLLLAAFVVRPERPVQWLDLGPAAPVTAAVDRWRQTLGRGVATAGGTDPAAELRRLVWEPLEPYLGGATTVLVSPDGALNRFPLAALPGKAPGSYLIEDLALAVIPVPQLLPDLLAHSGAPARDPSLLVVGNVDYGLERTQGGPYWPLVGTLAEADGAQSRFRARYPAGIITPLEEARATKEAVGTALPKARWAHLATHGYFAGEEVVSALAPGGRQPVLGRGGTVRNAVVGLHPGLLSGLVFAGANCPPADDPGAGILTALEVAAMDLSGLDTAMLSACNTGRGKEAGGEGVLGLQRAFQVAGARTVVASLWSVPDRETRDLMETFYDNLWHKGMGKLEALRQAQLAVLKPGPKSKSGTQRGLIPTDEPAAKPSDRCPPFYWAAFVLSGDWR
jgi:tetratricopeptide (TPR) repeat protein/CHAT domain-containing protein